MPSLCELRFPLLDVGTGPGFPGIPLKIMFPDRKIILAEGVRRRVDFLKAVRDEMKLTNLDIVGRNVDDTFELPVKGVITRAVEEVGFTLKNVSRCLEVGGDVFFMKGPKLRRRDRLRRARVGRVLRDGRRHPLRFAQHPPPPTPVDLPQDQGAAGPAVIQIDSAANARYRRWRDLLEARGIREHGLALLPGRKLIDEVLAQDPSRVREILLGPKHEPLHPDIPHARLGGELFRALDVVGTNSPLAVITATTPSPWTPGPPEGLELILALSDPGNLGACLRSAEAFGVTKVILTEECASPYLPKALKAAAGSTLRLNLTRAKKLSELETIEVVGLSQNGQSIQDFNWPKNLYLALGEEGRGLPKTWNGPRLKIPMNKKVDSLNATVAASLALFSYVNARRSEQI